MAGLTLLASRHFRLLSLRLLCKDVGIFHLLVCIFLSLIGVLDTVALPNYTGSLGFGEKYVRKLLGECGTLDVGDCMASVRHLIELGVSEEGVGKQLIQGGSHGGFLTAHSTSSLRTFIQHGVQTFTPSQ
jgi:hypothetical protein